MPRFPFVVARQKAVVVEAPSLPNALDRVLLRHQGKWVKVNFARNVQRHLKPNSYMDLISAQQKVKLDSKSKKGILFYIILVDDEFEIRDYKTIDTDKDNIYSVWRDGTKIESPHEEPKPAKDSTEQKVKADKIENKNQNSKTMSTKMKSAPKKVAKKVAAKKESKPTKVKTTPRGNNMFLTEAEWKKVDALLAKEGISFSAWSRGLVQAKIK